MASSRRIILVHGHSFEPTSIRRCSSITSTYCAKRSKRFGNPTLFTLTPSLFCPNIFIAFGRFRLVMSITLHAAGSTDRNLPSGPSLPKTESRSASRRRSGERSIWQRRFWEHTLRDEGDFARHVDYVHFNPVKHGYVNRAIDWPWSSIHRFVKNKILSEDWSADPWKLIMDLG